MKSAYAISDKNIRTHTSIQIYLSSLKIESFYDAKIFIYCFGQDKKYKTLFSEKNIFHLKNIKTIWKNKHQETELFIG